MRRTLHINTERTWRGGEAQTLLLIRGLREMDHTADLACQPGSPLAHSAEKEGARVIPLRFRSEVDPLAIAALRRLLNLGRYEILHAHTSHAHTLAVLAAFGKRTKVVVSRRVDFSIFRRSFFGLNGLKYRYGFSALLCVSEAVRGVLLRDKVPPGLIRVVPSGIDPGRFPEATSGAPFPPDIPVPQDAPKIVSIGHLTPHKGQIHLIRAFPKVLRDIPGVYLLIIGQGELQHRLEAETARLGLQERVILGGFRSDIGAILANATVYVMPSLEEGLGTSVLDAFLFSLPVVASRAGGLPEMVEHRVNGLMVPPGDPESLAGAITELLSKPRLRGELGQAGRRTALERFNYGNTVRQTIRIYEQILKAKPGLSPKPKE